MINRYNVAAIVSMIMENKLLRQKVLSAVARGSTILLGVVLLDKDVVNRLAKYEPFKNDKKFKEWVEYVNAPIDYIIKKEDFIDVEFVEVNKE